MLQRTKAKIARIKRKIDNDRLALLFEEREGSLDSPIIPPEDIYDGEPILREWVV